VKENGSEIWKVYGITEDEHIEYFRCLEKLESLGFEKIEVDEKILNCSTALFAVAALYRERICSSVQGLVSCN